MLGSVFGGGDDEAGRQMMKADGGVGLVPVLSACAARSECRLCNICAIRSNSSSSGSPVPFKNDDG